MMKKRRRARELALKILFQWDVSAYPMTAVQKLFWGSPLHKGYAEEIVEFANKIVTGIAEEKATIDNCISCVTLHWTIDRMSVVDRNILRAGVYELLFCEDIPPKTTINEYIEIAKKYGDTKSSSFVNGLLDKIHREKHAVSA
jgi:transcription antitermination factor NusB